jgi:hypothetical protein
VCIHMVFSFDKCAHCDINQRIQRIDARNIILIKTKTLKVIFYVNRMTYNKLNTKNIYNSELSKFRVYSNLSLRYSDPVQCRAHNSTRITCPFTAGK